MCVRNYICSTRLLIIIIRLINNPFLTFTRDIRTKPLCSVVVEEAFGVREPDGEVARVASVLQDSLEGEGRDVGGAVVSCVLYHGWVHAIN